MTCLGDFRIEEIRDKNNATGLKQRGGIEMSTTVAIHIRVCNALLRLEYLPTSTHKVVHKRTKAERMRRCILMRAMTLMHSSYVNDFCNSLIAM